MSGKHVKEEIQNLSEVGECSIDIHTDIFPYCPIIDNLSSLFLLLYCQASWAERECDSTFSVSKGETKHS